MAAPRYEIVQKHIQNPHATQPLILPILVLCNTSDDDLERNIRANTLRDLEWVKGEPAHDRIAVMVGGGPSVAEFVGDIARMQAEGAAIFAINGASRWLRGHGIIPDYQVISDAKEETATLVDPYAPAHLFASQVNPATLDAVDRPLLWHLDIGDIERFFPESRVKRGGYALLGGGAATGNSALCVAYALGFRTLHAFGYDSSHRGDQSHAYDQPMNRFIPTIDVAWAGKSYTASVAMKAQAEKFQMTAQALKQLGCAIHVHGDGLLQHMYTTPPENLTEQDKYRLIWQFDGYREHSPGEELVGEFLERVKPDGLVIDFGCGTGRAGLAIRAAGLDVLLIDFADNCRDHEALSLPFLQWDLTHPCPAWAHYGLCTDVMEHVPTAYVETVVRNIMASTRTAFFQIATRPDQFGALIGQPLHLTVRPHGWWAELFAALGFVCVWEHEDPLASKFIISRKDALPCH